MVRNTVTTSAKTARSAKEGAHGALPSWRGPASKIGFFFLAPLLGSISRRPLWVQNRGAPLGSDILAPLLGSILANLHRLKLARQRTPRGPAGFALAPLCPKEATFSPLHTPQTTPHKNKKFAAPSRRVRPGLCTGTERARASSPVSASGNAFRFVSSRFKFVVSSLSVRFVSF